MKDMKKLVIAFDVDNTILNIGDDFTKWLINQDWYYKYFDDREKAINLARTTYNITALGFLKPEHRKLVNDWWKCNELYDDKELTEDAIKTILELKKLGHDVIFATHVEGNHAKSKYEMIKRAIGEPDAFIAIRQKYYVACDYLVDDRAYNLMNLGPNTKGIHVKTDYIDELGDVIPWPKVDRLEEILEIIKDH